MDPKNTVGKQITGQERDDLPDQQPGAVREQSTQAGEPSEVEHPHAREADHLRPPAPGRREGTVSDPDAPGGGGATPDSP